MKKNPPTRINISVKDDAAPLLEELDQILNIQRISRSLFFRTMMRHYISEYDFLLKNHKFQTVKSANTNQPLEAQ